MDNSNLCEGPIFKRIITYAIPIIGTNLLQLVFNAADLIVVGRYCGNLSVAAVGATNSIVNLLINFFIGLSVGVGVTVAHAYGSGNRENAKDAVHTAIPVAVISGLILTLIGLFLSRQILTMMATPVEVIDLSVLYLKIYLAGSIASLVYNFGAAILRAVGDTASPFRYLVIAGTINVIFNLIFVLVFDMNVAGVAIATVISQIISAGLVLINLSRRTDAVCLSLKEIRIKKEQLVNIIRIGVPTGLQSSLFGISNVLIQSSINSFGPLAVSGNAASASIEGFVYVSMNSFQHTALNFTGQNFGAKKFDRIKKIVNYCLLSVSFCGLLFGGLAYIFRYGLLGIYITDSAEAIEYGALRIAIICCPYLLCGIMDVVTGTIRGMGISVPPLVISVMCICAFRIIWIFTVFRIPEFHTPASLYITYPISWTMTFVGEYIVYRIALKKYMNKTEMAN